MSQSTCTSHSATFLWCFKAPYLILEFLYQCVFLVELLFKVLKEKQNLLLSFMQMRHAFTHLYVTLYLSSRTIFSAVNREVSCLSLLLTSLSISCCLFKWLFSSSSSSTRPCSSLFNSSSSSAFSSRCLKSKKNQDDSEITSLIKKWTPLWVFYLRCELSSLIFLWRTLVISSVLSFDNRDKR